MGFDGCLDDHHVAHKTLLAPGFGGIGRRGTGAFQDQRDIGRREGIVDGQGSTEQRQPEWRCDDGHDERDGDYDQAHPGKLTHFKNRDLPPVEVGRLAVFGSYSLPVRSPR